MDFVPNRAFASAASYYARYRSTYPAADVVDLVRRLEIDRSHTVADIGCGTGQLSLALAEHAGRVIAIDPVAGMLRLGQQAAGAAGLTNITWALGDSEHLDLLVPAGAYVATFAASFHWMDRLSVAHALDGLLDGNGAMVTINDILQEQEQPEWARAADSVRRRYLGDDCDQVVEQFTQPILDHGTVLRGSPFCEIERLIWEWERPLTAEEVVGLQSTYSVSTPERLADRASQFARDLYEAVHTSQPDNTFIEPFRVEVLIARRARQERAEACVSEARTR
jgi:SAM-dependent methyltransferase